MSDRWLLTLVFLGTLLAQSWVVEGEFLQYDDARFVERNRSIDDLSNTARFFYDLETTAAVDAPTRDIYRPLRSLSYAIIANVAGKRARAFHFVSLLLHAFSAVALFLVLRRAGCVGWPALVGALFWGIHPVTVEVTAWISSLGDVECGLLSLLSILAYADRRRVVAIVLLALALLAKEAAVVVPGIWLAWDWFLRREETRANAMRAVGPGLALVIGFLVLRGAVLDARMSQLSEPLGGSNANAVRTMLAGYGFYLSTILFPFGSTADANVPIQTSPTTAVLLGALLLAGTVAAVFRGPARSRLGFAWFLMALVPASNVLVTLKIPTADRFLYLPLMGCGLIVAEVCARWPAPSRKLVPVGLVLLAALTYGRIQDWRDDGALLAAWKRVNPKSAHVLWMEAAQHAKKSVAAIQDQDVLAAQHHYSEAMRLYDTFMRNVQGRMQVPIGVWMEAAELSLQWARFNESFDRPDASRAAYSQAFTWFRVALQRQQEGSGRVVEEEVLRAATQVAELATRLTDMRNPEIERTIKTGMKAMQFLQGTYGIDTTIPFARLLLAYGVRIRTKDPAQARDAFDRALAAFLQYERDGTTGLSYYIAQCVYYRSFLGDREYDRKGVQRAYALYVKAARERPSYRYWALLGAARAKCAEGRIFKDAQAIADGREILDRIEADAKKKSVRLPHALANWILTERSGCVSRG